MNVEAAEMTECNITVQEAAQRDQRPPQEERNPFELPDILKLRYEITECEAYGFLGSGDQSQ